MFGALVIMRFKNSGDNKKNLICILRGDYMVSNATDYYSKFQ